MYYLITDIDRNYYATLVMSALIIIFMFVIFIRAKGWVKFKQLLNPPAQYLETRNILKSIQFIPESMLTTNKKGVILYVNARTHDLFGWEDGELLGKRVSTLLPEVHEFEKFYLDNKDNREENHPKLEARRKNAELFYSEVIVGQWTDDNAAKTAYFTVIIRNISHRKANEDARAALQRQITMISSLSIMGEYILQSGAWSWDLINDVVDCSTGFCKIFSIQTTDRLTAKEVIGHIYFEDQPFLTGILHQTMETKTGYDIVFRVVQKNGSKDRVRSIGTPVLNDNGKMIKLDGAIMMIEKNV